MQLLNLKTVLFFLILENKCFVLENDFLLLKKLIFSIRK